MNTIDTCKFNTNQSGLHAWVGNDKDAYNQWKIAADLEDTDAYYNLACCYHQGIGALQLIVHAHASFPHTYVCAQGCTKNADKAVELYFRAGQGGNIGALYNLVSKHQQNNVFFS